MDKIQSQTIEVNKQLDQVYSMDFTKRELLVLFNILTTIEYRYGDALVVIPIIEKVKGVALAASELLRTTQPSTNNVVSTAPSENINLGKKSN